MNDVIAPRRTVRAARAQKPKTIADKPAPPASEPENGAFNLPQPALSDSTQLQMPKPEKRHRAKWFWLTLGVALLVLTGATVAAYFWYKDALKPISSSQERIKVEVGQGATASSIATQLQGKQLIKSALALQIFIRVHNAGGDIKAGTYMFTPSQGPVEMLQWLQQGRVDTFKVTILPGKTLAQIKTDLQQYGYSASDIDAAFKKQYTGALFNDKPDNTSLEGYIFPDTYFVNSDMSVGDILQQSFDEFEKKLEDTNLRVQLAQHNLSLYQGITLASIVEKEVTNESDQRQVAQVFETRLQVGMPLGSDVTYHYAASLLGVDPSPDLQSPYNTRIHTGLPPGPIANFNFAALDAVANPASGDYLYFVAGDDGVTHFAHTEQEHEANIKLYCQKLCAVN